MNPEHRLSELLIRPEIDQLRFKTLLGKNKSGTDPLKKNKIRIRFQTGSTHKLLLTEQRHDGGGIGDFDGSAPAALRHTVHAVGEAHHAPRILT